MRTEFHALAADGVLMLHAAFVVFVVVGQLLILLGWWRSWVWTRGLVFRVLHLIAIGVVVLEAWFGSICPLTALENWLRRGAGQLPYELSFIGYWLRQFLFYSAPAWVFTIVYTLFAALVIGSFVLYPPQRNAGWKHGSKSAE